MFGNRMRSSAHRCCTVAKHIWVRSVQRSDMLACRQSPGEHRVKESLLPPLRRLPPPLPGGQRDVLAIVPSHLQARPNVSEACTPAFQARPQLACAPPVQALPSSLAGAETAGLRTLHSHDGAAAAGEVVLPAARRQQAAPAQTAHHSRCRCRSSTSEVRSMPCLVWPACKAARPPPRSVTRGGRYRFSHTCGLRSLCFAMTHPSLHHSPAASTTWRIWCCRPWEQLPRPPAAATRATAGMRGAWSATCPVIRSRRSMWWSSRRASGEIGCRMVSDRCAARVAAALTGLPGACRLCTYRRRG